MLVIGILNVTPDSFADGGRHNKFEAAIARGKEMLAEGVDIIDVGGESTRPGADRIDEEIEQKRVLPVIAELAKLGATISIDTMRASTALLAVKVGAKIINDVSGGLADPLMMPIAATAQVPYVIMHWRGQSKDMASRAIYSDVVDEVITELHLRVGAALAAGISSKNIILDPGIGFAKDIAHNWEIIEKIDQFVELDFPILIGASRKRFLGGLNPDDREAASVEITKRLKTSGIWGVRVHSVAPHKEVINA